MNFWLANNGPSGNGGRTTPGAWKDPEDDFPLPPPKVLATTTRKEVGEGEEKLIPPPRIRIRQTTNIDKDVWRMILLNLYPVTYLVLWLPGIANRIAEASGNYSRALGILQSSTQYIGFANACVYGFKEHWDDVVVWWRGRGGGGALGRRSGKGGYASQMGW
ncbi:Glucose receptor Git3 [Macrophomina phaseolina MS6]|uniref:Glucose receptor Git3 n=2 Tax=Macrophomina phaseolina TaxID=35725 RepID=K2RN17_MACPH|nr:Glucose receptor Git3 [Macrophomina phaseolina MS6]